MTKLIKHSQLHVVGLTRATIKLSLRAFHGHAPPALSFWRTRMTKRASSISGLFGVGVPRMASSNGRIHSTASAQAFAAVSTGMPLPCDTHADKMKNIADLDRNLRTSVKYDRASLDTRMFSSRFDRNSRDSNGEGDDAMGRFICVPPTKKNASPAFAPGAVFHT